MEAHIVSESPNGPRYRPLEAGEVDDPDNFILLCPTDHAVVDKQDSHYSEEELRDIKRRHEEWVRQHGAQPLEIRIRDPHAREPTMLLRAATGAQLMGLVGGSAAMQTSEPDDLTSDEVDLLASFLQNISDWCDLWNELGPGEKLRAEHGMTLEIEGLLEAGFVVYAGTRGQILEGGVAPPMPWRLAVMTIFRVDDVRIRNDSFATDRA